MGRFSVIPWHSNQHAICFRMLLGRFMSKIWCDKVTLGHNIWQVTIWLRNRLIDFQVRSLVWRSHVSGEILIHLLWCSTDKNRRQKFVNSLDAKSGKNVECKASNYEFHDYLIPYFGDWIVIQAQFPAIFRIQVVLTVGYCNWATLRTFASLVPLFLLLVKLWINCLIGIFRVFVKS
jgi:hypothetical protein